MRNILVIFLSIFSTNLFSQYLIKPGDQVLNLKVLTNYKINCRMQFLDTDGNIKYESIIEKKAVVNKSAKQFTLVQTRSIPNDKIIDSTIADLQSLAPIRMSMHSDSKNQEMSLQFLGKQIKAFANKQGKKTDTAHTINEPYFDSNLLEQILGIIKYEKDSVFKLNTYAFEAGGLDSYIIKNKGKEVISLNNTDLQTWHIIVYQQKSMDMGNKQGIEFWIDPHRSLVVKQLIDYKNRGQFIMILMQE